MFSFQNLPTNTGLQWPMSRLIWQMSRLMIFLPFSAKDVAIFVVTIASWVQWFYVSFLQPETWETHEHIGTKWACERKVDLAGSRNSENPNFAFRLNSTNFSFELFNFYKPLIFEKTPFFPWTLQNQGELFPWQCWGFQRNDGGFWFGFHRSRRR